MKKTIGLHGAVLLTGLTTAGFTTGCALLQIAALVAAGQDRNITVVFVNTTDSTVEVELATSDQDDVPGDVLDDIGELLNFNVTAGNTTRFTLTCDEAQSIAVTDADLLIGGELGPETQSGVLTDGDDFGCGDTITFTFSSDNPLDLTVRTSVSATDGG